MLIELRGAHLENKGAALMLIAMVTELRKRIPYARLAIAPSGMSPFIKRASLGLYQKLWLDRYGVQWGYAMSRLLPSQFKDAYGLVDDSAVNVVLDSSGFAYSDQWGRKYSRQLERATSRWDRQGTCVVLMPQAFGPFRDQRISDDLRKSLPRISKIYARDRISHSELLNLGTAIQPGALSLAGDFTNTLLGVRIESFEHLRNKVCLVPNMRMIDRGAIDRSEYIRSFVEVAARLRDEGIESFMLVHEGEGDRQLAHAVVSSSSVKLEIVDPGDTLIIKGIIGISRAMIGSRFHGLVSALSQGVPVVATGWSHKYSLLLGDYGVDGMMPDPKLPLTEEVLRLADKMLLELDSQRKLIEQRSLLLKEKTQCFWDQLVSHLESVASSGNGR